VVEQLINLNSTVVSQNQYHAGIHLSGANTPKTSLIVLKGQLTEGPLIIDRLYEKIGSFGSLFSDDRLIDIISHLDGVTTAFVDCPLTLPPCASCTREVCPGVNSCDDLSVAYMMSIGERVKGYRGKKKKRPINPQTHRLWDLMQIIDTLKMSPEPSFSLNMTPLVIRARALSKRLNSLTQPDSFKLNETSVAQVLSVLSRSKHFDHTDLAQKYRRFEGGREMREVILDAMIREGWLSSWTSQNHQSYAKIVRSVENFQSLITAWVAAVFDAGGTVNRPDDYIPSEGWVYLPSLQLSASEHST
jgi:hypothetical protein